MFVCSPVFPVWQLYTFSTHLGFLRVTLDEKSGIIGGLEFVDNRTHAEERTSFVTFMAKLEPIQLPRATQPFFQTVYDELSHVLPGNTISYGELARKAGKPGAARAVGQAMARNKHCLLIPCHRVLPANGSIGSYRWGGDRKSALLKMETTGHEGWKQI